MRTPDAAARGFTASARSNRARAASPLLRDSNLDLVSRELERVRALRYDLPLPEEVSTDAGDS